MTAGPLLHETTAAPVLDAVGTAGPLGLSHQDGAIVEAARLSGCDVVLSEDMSDGADHGGVRTESPFRGL